jgi:hypothetical protein
VWTILGRTNDAAAVSPRRRALAELVESNGLVGDDAAYPVFIRNERRAGGVVAPWIRRDDPDRAWRHDTRELGWWARWIATECDDRRAWLASQPQMPAPWAIVAAAVVDAPITPGWQRLDAGGPHLLAHALAEGVVPPPWLGGHPPRDDIDWNNAPDDRDRWAWWVFATFEDAASWRRYLARWPPPPAWQAALDEQLLEHLCRDGA